MNFSYFWCFTVIANRQILVIWLVTALISKMQIVLYVCPLCKIQKN